MDISVAQQIIKDGRTALGIELGSTRIKAVLVSPSCETLAVGSFGWENDFQDGLWTYDLATVWKGIQTAFAQLADNVAKQYGAPLAQIDSIGISAMMHGYLAFDKQGWQLAQFRTWRNNTTAAAAQKLTKALGFNIPQRWSVAHLYQAILNREEHVKVVAYLTTLAGYVHWQLTGEKVIGIGDASGMFPIDEETGTYDAAKLKIFDELDEVKEYPWKLEEILPQVLSAGAKAGTLTEAGAKLLDPAGKLQPGSLMAPPEGDAGTGMVATNSVRKRTGNISVGTSAFSMNVLDKPLQKVHEAIDIVTTPEGAPVAMVHTNNCSSDLNAWMNLLGEAAQIGGNKISSDKLYELLFNKVTEADTDAGGLINYACLSGENITAVEKGRPLFMRTPTSKMNLANFILAQLYGAFAPLKIGMDILSEEEKVATDVMLAQGGLFKTPVIAQQVLADMLNLPITVMSTAGEGGAWGMAVLAVYAKEAPELSLADFLEQRVFQDTQATTLQPKDNGVEGAKKFIAAYKAGLSAEQAAANVVDR